MKGHVKVVELLEAYENDPLKTRNKLRAKWYPSENIEKLESPSLQLSNLKIEGDDFPTSGITIKGIKSFIKANGGEDAFTGLRTTDICEKFLKPATAHVAESYCQAFGPVKGKREIDQATCLGSRVFRCGGCFGRLGQQTA